jgi:ABC-type multidrug transport system fused ATPase/permease subunit
VAGDAANQDMVYVAVFFAIGVGSLLCGLLRAVVMVIGTVRASRRLHSQLLSKIMVLPMMFFDTQVRRSCALFGNSTQINIHTHTHTPHHTTPHTPSLSLFRVQFTQHPQRFRDCV